MSGKKEGLVIFQPKVDPGYPYPQMPRVSDPPHLKLTFIQLHLQTANQCMERMDLLFKHIMENRSEQVREILVSNYLVNLDILVEILNDVKKTMQTFR